MREFGSAFCLNQNSVAPHLRAFTEINAALFAEAAVHELLIVDAAQPAGVEAAGKGHLHLVFSICDLRFTSGATFGA